MKTKHMILIVVGASFIISLLISTFLTYTTTEALTETRKSALAKTLSQAQVKLLGAFHNFDLISSGFWTEQHYVNEEFTAKALWILKVINASDYVNVDQAIGYIASKQYRRDSGAGGFGAYFGVDGAFRSCDLYSTYMVVRVLNLYDSLNKINQTLLMDFILKRYNGSIGAFHELVTVVDGKEYAYSSFPLVFRSFKNHIAYALPNIITTYAGVCVLKELGRLDLINATRVFEWVMHCQAENGMFKPYPDASYMPLPDWSPLKTNPFEVDRYGTGIPYTFAAISILQVLGRLDAVSSEDRQRIEDYMADCQTPSGTIYIHKDYNYDEIQHTYEVVVILHYFGMLDQAEEIIAKIEEYFQSVQALGLDNSWLIPGPGYVTPWGVEELEHYGLFYCDMGEYSDSYYAVATFNVTEHLNLLNQPTPRVQRTWLNLIMLSALVTAITTATLIAVLEIQKRRQRKTVEAKPT